MYVRGVLPDITEDLTGGVIQASDDSGQGEWREIDVEAIQEVSFAFSFHENEGTSKNLVSIALCGNCKSVKSARAAHTQPFAEEPLSRLFWHQQTKGISFRIAFFSSDLGCRTCCPALSSQDTNQWGWVK